MSPTFYGDAPAIPKPQRRHTDRLEPTLDTSHDYRGEPTTRRSPGDRATEIHHRPNVSGLTEVLVPEFMIWLGDRALTPTPVDEARMRELVGVWRDRERRGIRVVRRDVLVTRSEWAEVAP